MLVDETAKRIGRTAFEDEIPPLDKEVMALCYVIPTQTIFPTSPGEISLILIVSCVISLIMMVRLVLVPSMNQVLRLNED